MGNMNIALTLLAVGMGTVFIVLLFVIYFSKGMIMVINRFWPEQETAKPGQKSQGNVPAKIVAAITTAVNVASGGKASVYKIEKENK